VDRGGIEPGWGCLISEASILYRFMIETKYDLSIKTIQMIVMKKLFLVAVGSIVLTSCAATSTGPVAAGPGTYVVSRQAGAFPSGREPLLSEALGEATATCANQKKTLKVISTNENAGPYILGNYPKATVMFSCE
jgi:hypothetical protein